MNRFLITPVPGAHKKDKIVSKKTFTSTVLLFACFNLTAYLSGCNKQPTTDQLQKWQQEAIARNQEMVATHQQNPQSNSEWQLKIEGKNSTGQQIQLSLSKLQTLANTSIQTQEPHNTTTPEAIVSFRGVPVSTLLDEFGVDTDVKEVTFVSYDGYRATVSIEDLRQYPILIALERNGKEIARSEGGPLYLVFPYSDFPQLQSKYRERFWAFYLTNIVLGTEPIQLQVGKRFLDETFLQQLPQVTIEEAVGYRIGWPVSKTKLQGVLVRDVLAAAGLQIPKNGAVIIQGKSPVYSDAANPIRIEASELNSCDILLATHWGEDAQPIPAKMGGPLTLALASDCHIQSDNNFWVTFVEKLEVTP
ncbi:MAG: molybdopterin-dependent oxidoreductase [Symploca sp. SIO3C6]|uniref:Molybdopterin-dependent oxidoreductase n=1 Tax=Symploca sp. SIO1C4 TaxID=2607765 RepID=A0A6B3NH02_9CYAN|nr:molybdopterin-dependent oxidoreductase [Symploca sp. SIO3C6]NER29304.1 molybdopterin-dependent oxidoreductase [Symploca sp. SIO1C4]NET05644.1 molybdopterin-dependent oxidoreductase [Symploca sp. SIO2B6]NET51378.1 molybdopterin-dependent oxidoreductase [Merismopedia sp. SIO2A8]